MGVVSARGKKWGVVARGGKNEISGAVDVAKQELIFWAPKFDRKVGQAPLRDRKKEEKTGSWERRLRLKLLLLKNLSTECEKIQGGRGKGGLPRNKSPGNGGAAGMLFVDVVSGRLRRRKGLEKRERERGSLLRRHRVGGKGG